MLYRGVARFDDQLAAFRHGIARIQCKIDDRALDLPRVALRRPKVGFKNRRQGNLFSQGPSQQRRRFENNLIEVQYLDLEMAAPSESEKSIRQLSTQIRGLLRFLHQLSYIRFT